MKEYGRWWRVLAQISKWLIVAFIVIVQPIAFGTLNVSAQTSCAVPVSNLSPRRVFNSGVGAWSLDVSSQDYCDGATHVEVTATRDAGPSAVGGKSPGGSG